MRRTVKRIKPPMYFIRCPDGTPFLLGGAMPDGQRWKFLPLFESESLAKAFQSVAADGSETFAAAATWDELDEVVQAAQLLGCQRVAWSPDRIHMKELVHDAVEDVLRVIRKEEVSN